jgi:predicted permease
VGKLLRRLQYLFRQRRLEAELAEELEFHRAQKQQRLEEAGVPFAEAVYSARRALGNVTLAREDVRGVWIWPVIERGWHDLRHGVRVLRHHRTFAVTSILTLAIGVGTTTTAFSVVEGELWRPLPFPHADRLVAVFTTGPGARDTQEAVSVPDFLDWRTQTHAFDGLAGFRWTERRVLSGRDMPESLRVMPVTSNFFATLERLPALGRTFGPVEDRGGRSVILSGACWRRLFAADTMVIGRTVSLDDEPYSIVGVTAADARLEFLAEPDLFVNIDLRSSKAGERGARDLLVIGRLKENVDVAAAAADIRTLAQRLAREYAAEHVGQGAGILPLRAAYLGYNWRPLFFFLGAAAFVLLLSCANVASLLLARALARQREFAIRGALGGGRGALVRQLAVEGALLALPAAAIGLVLTSWALRIIPAWVPRDYLYRSAAIAMDSRVYVVAVGLSGLTALMFGVAPAFFATRHDLSSTLGHGGRVVAGSPAHRRARHAVVVAEVTVALLLLFGAGLFLNSFLRLTNLPLGFDPRDRLTMRIQLTGARYSDLRQVVQFSQELLGRVGSLPGVHMAAVASDVPLGSGPLAWFVVADRPRPSPGEESTAIIRAVSPEFFNVLDIRRLLGRDFVSEDVAGAPAVAVINEHLARRFFPGENPVGRALVVVRSSAIWAGNEAVRIVGVVANVKDVGLNEVDFNDIYVPIDQAKVPSIQLVVNTAVPPSGVVDALRREVVSLDPHLPVTAVTTMAQRLDDALRTDRFNLLLIGAFAVIAIVLAGVGIYGAMSCAIEQRTQEFGVRLALGARPAGILGLALGHAARLSLAGTGLGLVLSLALGRVLGSALYLVPGQHDGLIYGVNVTDPLTLAAACSSLIGITGFAALIPARRATRIDPIVALRQE